MFANLRSLQNHRAASPSGFSLLEIIVMVALIGIIAAIAVDKVSVTSVSVGNTKLTSDVKKLNEVVAVYLASGGSLANATTPQQVLDQLKTVVDPATQNRQVSVMTGTGVDVRQVATIQTASQALLEQPARILESHDTAVLPGHLRFRRRGEL